MGVQDRDWYREEHRKRKLSGRHFDAPPRKTNWLVIAFFWVVVLFVLFQIVKRFEGIPNSSALVTKARGVFVGAQPTMAPVPVSPLPHTTNAEVERQQPPVRQAQPTQPEQVAPPPQRMPPQGSVTIYRCKAYAGGVFWSTAYCGTQQALIDRTATVPGGMPFAQQVQIAEGQRTDAMRLYDQVSPPAVQTAVRCLALQRERAVIESRYSNWQWQPPEVINPDQTRMRGLRAEQARLGCPTQ